MNYRHSFHAGNFADVHKHVVLLALLERLTRKPKPIFYLDTHAGRGRYDLAGADAARGAEWREGVGRLLEASPDDVEVARYCERLLATHGRAAGLRTYAGSPLLALASLRPADRAVFVERQRSEAGALQVALPGRRNTTVLCSDGYAALKAYLPPAENRGLVLIDPPYESPHEFSMAEQALRLGLDRWPSGQFALWYPIKAGPEAQRLLASLRNSGLRKLLTLELATRPADSPVGLNGSGLLIANPPWQFDVHMRPALAALHRILSPDGAGGVRIDWLAEE